MKKIILIIALLSLGAGLQAQHTESDDILKQLKWDDEKLNILIDTRIDYQSDFSNGWQSGSFEAQAFKLWLAGEIVPGVRYRVRQRLNKPTTPLREGYSAATDQAWLAFDFAKRWTVTVGKQSVQFGTYEFDYNPADIYMPTMCYNDLDAYKTGVNIAYAFPDHTFNFQVVNSDTTQFAAADYANKALAMAFLWNGKMFDGLLCTRWAYGAFQHDKGDFLSWVTLGTQLNVNKFTAELDYYWGKRYMDYGSVVGADLGLRHVMDRSAALNLKYNDGKLRPSLKLMWNDRFDLPTDQDAYRIVGVSGVVEYYPFKGKLSDLRFHLVYSWNTTIFEGSYSATNNLNASSLIGGVRWLFKVK